MYKKIDWPECSHQAAACFNCTGTLDGAPVRSVAVGIGGDWHQHCAACDMRTFYDTPRPGNPGNLEGVEAKKGVNHAIEGCR